MNDLMWAELHYLNNVSPFKEESLTTHIESNPEEWNKIFDMQDFEFKCIPSKHMLDVV